MSKPVILLDMDDVLVNLCEPMCEKYNELYNDNLTVEYLCRDWHMHERAKCGQDIYKIFDMPGFMESLEAKPNAIASVMFLRHLFDIKIVTSISRSEVMGAGKILWLKKNMPWFDIDDVFFAKCKELVRGDIMIDDRPRNLERWKSLSPDGITMLFKAHHNHDAWHKFDFFVKDWDDVCHYLGIVYDAYFKTLRPGVYETLKKGDEHDDAPNAFGHKEKA